jgi:hypothetical protein
MSANSAPDRAEVLGDRPLELEEQEVEVAECEGRRNTAVRIADRGGVKRLLEREGALREEPEVQADAFGELMLQLGALQLPQKQHKVAEDRLPKGRPRRHQPREKVEAADPEELFREPGNADDFDEDLEDQMERRLAVRPRE